MTVLIIIFTVQKRHLYVTKLKRNYLMLFFSLSTLLDLSPVVQFDVIVGDDSKFNNTTDSSNADFTLHLNNKADLKNPNYDYKNKFIKTIIKELDSINRLEKPYTAKCDVDPSKYTTSNYNICLNPLFFSAETMNLSTCGRIERNYNSTALIKDTSVSDIDCEQAKLNNFNTILKWKNQLISKGKPSETSHYKYKRLVAVGDIHGDYEKLVSVMRHAKLIDKKNKWIARDTIFIQIGDLVDRGSGVKNIFELLSNLMKPAKKNNSLIQLVLGNHEVNNLKATYRYTSATDILSFGGIENREEAFSLSGKFGQIIRKEMDVVIKTNDSIFTHAGLSPEFAELGIEEINRQTHEILSSVPSFTEICELSKQNITHPLFTDPILNDSDSPLTNRHFSVDAESDICPQLEKTLEITKVLYYIR